MVLVDSRWRGGCFCASVERWCIQVVQELLEQTALNDWGPSYVGSRLTVSFFLLFFLTVGNFLFYQTQTSISSHLLAWFGDNCAKKTHLRNVDKAALGYRELVSLCLVAQRRANYCLQEFPGPEGWLFHFYERFSHCQSCYVKARVQRYNTTRTPSWSCINV